MKIVFIVKYYDVYRNQFYGKQKNINDFSFDETVQLYLNDYFSFYSSLVRILNNKGFDAKLFIPNCPVLKKKWRDETNSESASDQNFILNYCNEFKPDIIFLSSNFEYYGNFWSKLNSSKTRFFCWISCPFDREIDLSRFETIFTLFPPHHDFFKSKGLTSKLVTAGFDSYILNHLTIKKELNIDFSFVGGVGGFHKHRETYLKKIASKTNLQMWGYGYQSNNPAKQLFKQLKFGKNFLKKYRGEAWGLDMFNILANSQITLNVHGDIAKNHSVNMRLFEATGVGTLLLTDESDDLLKLFKPDEEIITFKNPNEAIEKYNYYMTHEQERLKIATAGQQRTLNDYSYENISQVFINEFLK